MAENQERDDAIYALGLERMNTLKLERILQAMTDELNATKAELEGAEQERRTT